MKKSIAMKWIKALRSGEYKQGNNCNLQSNEGEFCCLGVLCEVVGIPAERSEYLDGFYYAGVGGGLSPKAQELTTVSSTFGEICGYDMRLSTLNDSGDTEGRLNFEEIADVIEQVWKDL